MSENLEEEENQDPLLEKKENYTELQENNNNQNGDNNEQTKNLIVNDKAVEIIKKGSFIISRKIRWVIFSLFIVINLLMNFDHGTVPAATEQLRNYLNLSDSELGLFGSLVFVGVIIGSLVSLTIINTFNRKYILMFFLILCAISLFIFTKTKIYIILCIDRVIIGIFQAFISIYLPLWCDQFGIESRKALMIALIQVAPPLGVLVGYIVTTLLNMYLSWLPYFGDIEKDERWLYSFYIQSFIILIVSLSLLFFSDKYFNSKARRVPIEVEEELNFIESKKSQKEIKFSFFYNGNKNSEDKKENENCGKNQIEEIDNNDNNIEEKQKEENLDIKTNDKLDENKEKNKENNKEENEIKKDKSEDISFLMKLKLIFSEPFFVFCVLILSTLFFIVTCVQYWASDYMLVGLEIKDEKKRLFAFSFVCLTSPTLGLIVGGYVVDKIGGYHKKGALIFCLIFSLLSDLPAIPLPLVDSFYTYGALLWILLFLGAALIPPTQGIIIACLPKEVQGSGNSFVIFFYNLLGYLPAPFVYGFLKDYFDDKDDPKRGSRIAQKVNSWSTFFITFVIIIATIFRFKKDEEYNEKMGREKTKKIEDLNDDDAIRQRESSLALNASEHMKIAEKVFNESKDENENDKDNDNDKVKNENN